MKIKTQGHEIALVLDDDRLIPALEYRPDHIMLGFKPVGIRSVQVLNGSAEICLRRLYKQVEMVAHQDVGMNPHVMLFHRAFHYLKKMETVRIIMKDGIQPFSTRQDMIIGAFKLDAKGAGHEIRLARNEGYVKCEDLTPFSLQQGAGSGKMGA